MATFIVTTSRDVANGNVSKDDLSLREAIVLANAHADMDRIVFADDISKVKLRDALPRITDDLRLVGGEGITLDANTDPGEHRRALHLRGDDIEVTVAGLKITGGYSSGDGGAIRSGGGVDLRVVDCEIAGNASYGSGGGIFARGDLTLLRSRVATNSSYGAGGGLAVEGTTILRSSTIEHNGSVLSGGGLAARGDLTIVECEVLRNRTNINTHYTFGQGGGILSSGNLNLTHTIVAGNAAGQGGGIATFGPSIIRGCEIEGNRASGDFGPEGGGGIFAADSLYVRSSAIYRNSASGYYQIAGGGIYALGHLDLVRATVIDNRVRSSQEMASGGGVWAPDARVIESTISGNTASADAYYGGVALGGGIHARRLSLEASAIVGNVAEGDTIVQGGGIFARRIEARNSTVAGNEVRDIDEDLSGVVGGGGIWATRRADLTAVTVSGNEVTGSGVGGGISAADVLSLSSSLILGNAAADGDDDISGAPVSRWPSLVGSDARLVFAETVQLTTGIFGGVAADNGGRTPTIALLDDPSNPAIGAGDPGLQGARDQRGVTRDADPDLGAVEAFELVLLQAQTADWPGPSAELRRAAAEAMAFRGYHYRSAAYASEPNAALATDLML